MTNWSRRRMVQTAVAVSTVGLAGCGLPGGESEDGEDGGENGEDEGGENGDTEGEDGEESDARSSAAFAREG